MRIHQRFIVAALLTGLALAASPEAAVGSDPPGRPLEDARTSVLRRTAWSSEDRIASVPRAPGVRLAEDSIVYTAHQGWLSRIYFLDMTGTVIDYFEYEFYFMADIEVIDNEIYLAEAFAPRVLKLDIETGALDVVVDDWSLYYFYDVAFDDTHFYVTEWDLNRYSLDGTKVGTSPFDEDVMGSAWDGTHYWTLNDLNEMKCWDVGKWPLMVELPEKAMAPPTPACRGLWHDGEFFWTAESIDGILGYIYRFDAEGTVLQQWLEPAFLGWAAGVLRADVPGDTNGDGFVNTDDFLAVLAAWGPCPAPPADCPADISGDRVVNTDDFLAVLANWD